MSGAAPWKDAHGNYLEVEERDGVLLLTYGDEEESRAFPLDRDALPALVAALTAHMGARAVVAAHPTGPDQDQPAAWLWTDGTGRHYSTTSHEVADSVRKLGAEVEPVFRAREAQAAAPPGDEDGAHA